jgi:aspartyl-tRNA(Asn)/glutamyl-tRNA(Gln) amidotransferase subunit C
MSLELKDVTHIANLARIEISPAEAQATLAQLTSIFALIEEMQTVDTTGVEPMSHGIEVNQRLRQDRVTEADQRAANQASAPQVEAGLYLVPKVIE